MTEPSTTKEVRTIGGRKAAIIVRLWRKSGPAGRLVIVAFLAEALMSKGAMDLTWMEPLSLQARMCIGAFCLYAYQEFRNSDLQARLIDGLTTMHRRSEENMEANANALGWVLKRIDEAEGNALGQVALLRKDMDLANASPPHTGAKRRTEALQPNEGSDLFPVSPFQTDDQAQAKTQALPEADRRYLQEGRRLLGVE